MLVVKLSFEDKRVTQMQDFYTNKIYTQFLFLTCSGDLWSYNAEKDAYVVSPKPDMTVLDIDKNHCFVILATDGLWHVVEPAEAVDVVARRAAHMVKYKIMQ